MVFVNIYVKKMYQAKKYITKLLENNWKPYLMFMTVF